MNDINSQEKQLQLYKPVLGLSVFNLFLIIIIISSCKNKTEVVPAQEINIDSLKKSEFINKYSPICWDDTSYKYTYQLQNAIKKDSNFLLLEGVINDIVIKNGNLLVLIVGEFLDRRCSAQIIIPDSLKNKFESEFSSEFWYHECHLVVKLTDINSNSRFSVQSYVTKGGSIEEAESEIDFDLRNSITFIKGTLVDYYK